MIRLELTHTEAVHLQQALASLVSQSISEDVVVAFQSLVDRLGAACQQEAAQQLCPVCQRAFIQLNAGRLARYCSNACKQKAYRQRRLERKRQWRPDWLRQRRSSAEQGSAA